MIRAFVSRLAPLLAPLLVFDAASAAQAAPDAGPPGAAPGAAAGQAQAPLLSPTGQPTRFAVRAEPFVAAGYRSARFGMSPEAVRAAAARDFPGAEPVMGQDPVNRTPILSLRAPLPPGPGEATVSYVFGAASGRLMQVNVVWFLPDPTDEERAALTAAGSELVADLLGYHWRLMGVARGLVVGPGALVLFAGDAVDGGAVEVRLDGVPFAAVSGGRPVRVPPPAGPARLRLAYVADPANPDVYVIKEGDY